MNLTKLVALVSDKTNFTTISHYVDFCLRFLDVVADGLQAVIVSQNETHYCFYQYKKDGHFNVTRPINSIYTIQQSIGAALDALPAGKSNNARKINGDLFERLIRLLISELGVDCQSGVVKVPVVVDGAELFQMSYQHDLVVRFRGEVKIIGSVKTSSKDRIDKIFMDKFLYSRLAETDIPHIAVFLNDVQRKKTRQENKFGVSATFLPGHFKGYTIKLNPLDGVYYCDIRPNMQTDPLLKPHIQTIDRLFCTDLWSLLD